MLKSSLCDYCYTYIVMELQKSQALEQMIIPNEKKKGVKFKSCARFTDCINEINNAKQIIQKIMQKKQML